MIETIVPTEGTKDGEGLMKKAASWGRGAGRDSGSHLVVGNISSGECRRGGEREGVEDHVESERISTKG